MYTLQINSLKFVSVKIKLFKDKQYEPILYCVCVSACIQLCQLLSPLYFPVCEVVWGWEDSLNLFKLQFSYQ